MPDLVHPPVESGRARLRGWLMARNQAEADVATIDEQIRAAFERTVAVLVLDMVGFTRLTRQHGIIFYLAMIARMELAAVPAVEANGGRLVKQEADNLFAVFDHPGDAVEAALDIFRAFGAVNGVTPDDRDIHGSIGIGYGPTLLIDDADLFGDEVNLASKFGEDVAQQGEIILTPAAVAALPPGRYRCEAKPIPFAAFEAEGHYFRAKLAGNGREIETAPAPVG